MHLHVSYDKLVHSTTILVSDLALGGDYKFLLFSATASCWVAYSIREHNDFRNLYAFQIAFADFCRLTCNLRGSMQDFRKLILDVLTKPLDKSGIFLFIFKDREANEIKTELLSHLLTEAPGACYVYTLPAAHIYT